jgi:hypothetical protein
MGRCGEPNLYCGLSATMSTRLSSQGRTSTLSRCFSTSTTLWTCSKITTWVGHQEQQALKAPRATCDKSIQVGHSCCRSCLSTIGTNPAMSLSTNTGVCDAAGGSKTPTKAKPASKPQSVPPRWRCPVGSHSSH